jgi:hypothetical protein
MINMKSKGSKIKRKETSWKGRRKDTGRKGC